MLRINPTTISLALCLTAAALYLSFPKTSVKAFSCGDNECVYADKCYSQGACRPGQRCDQGNWTDDSQCVN